MKNELESALKSSNNTAESLDVARKDLESKSKEIDVLN